MINPIRLCGCSGIRLWPLSRKSYTKQFAMLMGGKSLFQAWARRFLGKEFAAAVVLTSDPSRFIVTEQLAQVEVAPSGILNEPEGRSILPLRF